jgi:hypothetical protein
MPRLHRRDSTQWAMCLGKARLLRRLLVHPLPYSRSTFAAMHALDMPLT